MTRAHVGAALVALAVGSVAVRLAGSQVSKPQVAGQPKLKAASVLRLGAAGVDPLERALEADRIRIRRFLRRTPQSSAPLSKPEGIDLDATYIGMTPLYHAYCLDYSIDGLPRLCEGTENDKRWPDRGELVTFTAHFVNKGTVASGLFEYSWAIDGTEVARGSFPNLQPGAGSVAVYVWPWDHDVVNGQLLGQHTVRFTLDPDNHIFETAESNNTLEDRTDATPLGFQITPEVYQALETPVDPTLPFSAEDWVQKQFHAMNDAFAESVYPSAPNGCEERVRLDQFRVTSQPVPNDGDIGGWFLSTDDRFNGSVDPQTDIDGPMLHELAHQLGIFDLYHLQIDWLVPHRILDQTGRPALMEQFASYRSGLMVDPGIQPPSFDEDTVGGMNRNKGYRRGYFGEYMWDTPSQVQVRVLDNQGNPAPGVTLKLFRMAQFIDYDGSNDNAPEMTVTTGTDGVATLPNRPAGPVFTTATGHTLRASPIGPIDLGGDNTFLVEINKGTHQEYAWLDITDINLLAWQGRSVLEMPSHVSPPDAPIPPAFLTGIEERNTAVLQWAASPTAGVRGYKVYRTSGPRDSWGAITDVMPDLTGEFVVDRAAIGFAVTAVDEDGRESGFSAPYWAMLLQEPDGIAIGANNQRFLRQWDSIILQGGDGRYLNIVRGADPDRGHLAFDPNGRLLVCRRETGSVAVVDPGGDPRYNLLFELTGPTGDQTIRPTGVTALGGPYTWGGPYVTDGQTALLCHFDGTVTSDNGIAGDGIGVSFAEGRFGQGIVIEQPATLSYPVAQVLAQPQGAVEFWLRPTWPGSDQIGHILLAANGPDGHGVNIEKDGAGNLRTIVWNGGPECGVGFNVANWEPGEWHHVGVTWLGSELSLLVDGNLVSRTESCSLPSDLSGNLWLGSAGNGDRPANGVFDELRVSDTERFGTMDTAGHILVADGGNDRLAVFNLAGDFVGSYGSPGVGDGQFRSPAGIATDGNGRVVVVDAGNRRLQLFGFDGTAFTFLRTIHADLEQPDGVAMRGDRIVVADTGHNQVKVFSDTGGFIAVYNGPNDGVYSGPFDAPRDVAIDNNGRIVVADTGNNRVVGVIHCLSSPCTGPDLIVSALTVPAGALAGSTISVTDTTKNQAGTSPASASTTKLYLSTNSTWDAADTLIGGRSIPALAAGASNSGSANVTIPSGTATGSYYIIAKADGDGVLFELNETNNTKYVSIRISPPDLIVSAISVPTTGGAGTAITATNTTKNQTGTAPAAASTTRFYLSTNATLDGGDPLIGSQAIGLLLPGASEAHSTTLNIPPSTTPGTYYVIAKADADNVCGETSETNNTASDTIVIGPDLIVSALSVPSTGGPGLPITVNDTTKNQGGGQASASTTHFYLSTNTTVGAGDVLLGSRGVTALNPGTSSPGSTTLTIPAGTAVGSYYVIAVADGPVSVAETVETNNTKYALIKLSPDLVASALGAPTSAAAGATITVTDTTKNQGAGTAAATTTSFYLSTNTTCEAGDAPLGSRSVPILAYAATSSGSTTVIIPAGTAPGTWYVLARADATNTVAEASETNNVRSKVITITP